MKRYSLSYNPIIEYWSKIKCGEVVVGIKVKRVYKKLVDDIHDQESVYEYSPERANHAIEFVEGYTKHSKGEMGGKPFILELWQKAMTAALFGFIHKTEDTRKYRECILIVGRKNGKCARACEYGREMV